MGGAIIEKLGKFGCGGFGGLRFLGGKFTSSRKECGIDGACKLFPRTSRMRFLSAASRHGASSWGIAN
jgi:hypothetical protein